MKLALFALLVAIVLGGLVGTLVVRDPGYVLLSYADWVLETSLWVALLAIIAVYALARFISYLLRRAWRGQLRFSQWRSGRRLRGGRRQTVQGLLVMAEGRWADAKRLLLNAAPNVETPLINYLNAARAAHHLGDREARDQHLKQADQSTAGAKFAVTLTQAEFNIADGQYEKALASLLVLRKSAPKHAAVLTRLVHCYVALEDWQALRDTLPDAKKHKALPVEELADIEHLMWSRLLALMPSVEQGWKTLPKAFRADRELLRDWVNALAAGQRDDDAAWLIRRCLEQLWDAELVAWYGRLNITDPARALVTAQSWYKERSNDATLSMTLGRLCMRNLQFEQAREYLESSLKLEPNQELYGELGRLCVALGDERRGTDYLLQSQTGLPTLPLPKQESASPEAQDRQAGIA